MCEKPSERVCPTCSSEQVIRNGSVHNGKPKYQCKSCGRQFVINPTNSPVSEETKHLIDRLLLERISLRGIARVTQVSWSWLQDYVNQKLARTPRQVKVSENPRSKLIVECDEMWSFVDSKKNEVYIWLAIDRNTRQVVGCFIGDRTRKSARKFWESLPAIYQHNAIAYTDFWQAYKTVILPNNHRAVGKETGLTNHVERLNNTFRQRVSRLVRESLSFSKKLNNHIGAIWYFIHGYNAELD
ncbi:IS1 family transposase [Chroococcidiopsis sp. SAG 2025]|uniref:IS1 family transposase n=1 Tax=Chroococcidiopsis sp. SAG 2025 TaxID=171389 RepID=UPI0029371136|nr:IS1 family transposase [Chroococcidiopsis sp. SAG 2025]